MGIKVVKAIKLRSDENYRKFNEAEIILFDTPGMEKSIEFQKINFKATKR